MRTFAATIFAASLTFPRMLAAQEEKSNIDPYLWLEDVHGARALDWVKDQNTRSLALLKADPSYQRDYDSTLSIMDATERLPLGLLDHQYVFNFWQDPANPKGIWRRTSIADYAKQSPHWETLLDLDELSATEHKSWVWNGNVSCSPSLTRCLVGLSPGGGDAVVVREFNLATKQFLTEGFTLPAAKSSYQYIDDDTVLFGSDFGKDSLTTSGLPRIVKLWKRGEPLAASRTVFEGKVTDVEVLPAILHKPDGNLPFLGRILDASETEYYLLATGDSWRKIPIPLSANLNDNLKGQLLFTLRENWTLRKQTFPKGSLIAIPLASIGPTEISSAHLLYAPGARASIEQVIASGDTAYVSVNDNVKGAIYAFRSKGESWTETQLNLPGGGSTNIISTNVFGTEALFRYASYLTPPTIYMNTDKNQLTPIKSMPERFDSSGLVTEEFEAKSTDGTKIPYFVTRPKNLKRPSPTLLYGYGGFELSLTPSYSGGYGQLWLARGGIYVVANIRGGGEFGPAWHEAALKDHRQRAFDDFAAVAEDLKRRGLTTSRQLGIMGGSNGGLLVSTVMVQHPDLFGAVVCQAPLIDMLRYTQIGAGASSIGEYGDPADPKMRSYLLRYSPYQNVKSDIKYPPIFFLTNTSDDRVTPAHARKMAAKMESQGHDVLFYENTEGGHALAADHRQAAEIWALEFVWLRRVLGLDAAR